MDATFPQVLDESSGEFGGLDEPVEREGVVSGLVEQGILLPQVVGDLLILIGFRISWGLGF